MAEKKAFLFYVSWAESLAELPPAERCEVYDAIVAYAKEGKATEPKSPMARMAFKFIRQDVDESLSKYDKTCEKRREAANRRWGKKRKDDESDTIASEDIQNDAKNANAYFAMHNKDKDKDDSTTASSSGRSVDTAQCAAYDSSSGGGTYGGERLMEEFFADENRTALECLAMKLRTDIDSIREASAQIVAEWTISRKTHRSYTDAADHLIRTLQRTRNWGEAPAAAPAFNSSQSQHSNGNFTPTATPGNANEANQREIRELVARKLAFAGTPRPDITGSY